MSLNPPEYATVMKYREVKPFRSIDPRMRKVLRDLRNIIAYLQPSKLTIMQTCCSNEIIHFYKLLGK